MDYLRKRIKNIVLIVASIMIWTSVFPGNYIYASEAAVSLTNTSPADKPEDDEADEEHATEADKTEDGTEVDEDGNAAAEEVAPDDTDPDDEKEDHPAFNDSCDIGGVIITVEADEGVFPDGAFLSVRKIHGGEEAAVDEAVEGIRAEDRRVAASYTYDIKIRDKQGYEIEPDPDDPKIRISFRIDKAENENLNADIYHVINNGDSEIHISADDLSVEKLDTGIEEINGEPAVSAETNGFSYYTVEFTYQSRQYVLPGNSSVPLTEILDELGLAGTVEDVEVSSPDLFSASEENGEWIVYSHEPFTSEEWMKVTIDGVIYEITVTDDPGEHVHQWSYTVSGASITASCNNTDRLHEGSLTSTLTIIRPARTVYGGTGDAEATISGNIAGVANPDIVYKQGTTVLGTAPTGAGTYTASITLGTVTASLEYTISKAAITPIVDITGWTYGNTANTPRITSGNPGNGSVSYNYAVKGSSDYSATVPVNAGDYTVKATIAETDNYESGVATKDFTIAKERLTGVSVTQSGKLTYNGKTQVADVDAKADQSGVSFTYSKSQSGSYSSSVPGFKDAGTYKVYYKAEKQGCETVTGSFNVKIAKVEIGIDWGTTSFTYDGNDHVPTAKATGEKGSDDLKLKVSGAASSVGTHTAEVTDIEGDGSENYTIPSNNTKKFTITKSSSSSSTSTGTSTTNTSTKTTTSTTGTTANTTKDTSGSKTTGTTSSKTSGSSSGETASKSSSSSGSTSKSSGSPSGNSADGGNARDKNEPMEPVETVLSEQSKRTIIENTKLADEDSALEAIVGKEKLNELTVSGNKPSLKLEVATLSEITKKEKDLADTGMGLYQEKIPGLTAGVYLDITLEVNEDGTWQRVTKTDEPISIVINIPEELRDLSDVFYVLRLHNGEATLLSDLDGDPATVTISTDRFSTYVLIYQPKDGAEATTLSTNEVTADAGTGEEADTAANEAVPVVDVVDAEESEEKNKRRIALAVILIIITLAGAGTAVFLMLKKKKEGNKDVSKEKKSEVKKDGVQNKPGELPDKHEKRPNPQNR